MPKTALNIRQQKFAELVAGGMTATKAYIKAGYAARGNAAEVSASQLLSNPKVAPVVAKLRAKTADKLEITREKVAAHLYNALITPISEIDKNSPLAQEMTETTVYTPGKNGAKGKTTVTRRIKSMGKVESGRLLCEVLGFKSAEKLILEDGPEKIKSAMERAKTIASPLNRIAKKKAGGKNP